MATELKTDIISTATRNQLDIEVAEEQMIVIDADGNVQVATAVSYTHLTLPTILRV